MRRGRGNRWPRISRSSRICFVFLFLCSKSVSSVESVASGFFGSESNCSGIGADVGSAQQFTRLRIDHDALHFREVVLGCELVAALLEQAERIGREAEGLDEDSVGHPLMVE